MGEPQQGTTSSTNVARRVTNWATNLLATGIILIGGLVFGRQILHWWGEPRATDTGPAAAVSVDLNNDSQDSPLLRFGESSSVLQRTTFEGDRAGVFAALRDRCGKASDSAKLSTNHQSGPAEKRLLQRVAQQEPVEVQAGKWRLFQLDGPVPLVVVVTDPRGANDGESLPRVVSWGLGVHLSGTRWALFILTTEDGSATGLLSRAMLPVPPGSQRTMSLQARGPDQLVGFRASGPVEQYVRFYQQWTKEHGWTISSDWHAGQNLWHARYRRPRGDTVDVQLVRQTDGNILGLLSAAGEPGESREK